MGMASVSWFYLFNIQVRANCTTACNIQAALQYVELTHVSSSVSFFLYVSFYKNVHAAWNRFQSHAGPAFFPGGRSLRAEQRMSIGVGCTDGSVWLVTFTSTEMHEGNCDSDSSFSVCLFSLIARQRNGRNQWQDCFFLFFFFLLFITTWFVCLSFFQKV